MEKFDSEERQGVAFRTTHWSVVLSAGLSPEGASAMEQLCRNYWFPLYTFVRRRGYPAHEAQDLTQEFFMRLMEGSGLEGVQPEKGKFRTYLLASMKHFLAKEWRDQHRIKRGGKLEFLCWEELQAEERFALEPHADSNPEESFDQHWARTLARNALDRLRAEEEREGNEARFEVLKKYLQSDATAAAYSETAVRIGLSEPAVKSAIYRLRRRYAQIVRDSIAQTVSSAGEVEEEIRSLIELLAH
jgi:RNA polymerase sigma-70 factor (ECF subfamily)